LPQNGAKIQQANTLLQNYHLISLPSGWQCRFFLLAIDVNANWHIPLSRSSLMWQLRKIERIQIKCDSKMGPLKVALRLAQLPRLNGVYFFNSRHPSVCIPPVFIILDNVFINHTQRAPVTCQPLSSILMECVNVGVTL